METEKRSAVALISFTDRGGKLNRHLAEELEKYGYSCRSYEKRFSASQVHGGSGDAGRQEKGRGNGDSGMPQADQGTGLLAVEQSAGQWAGQRFSDTGHIIFIGAAGIAVRSVAPWIRDKWTDPSVTVIDEAGDFVIPVLSGHAGGGNQLAREAAKILRAVPVITTATDINRLFAVDVFAVKNGLAVTDRKTAKEISAEILSGGKLGVFTDYPLEGPWPGELIWGEIQKKNLWITRRRGRCPWEKPDGSVLKLVPKVIHVGIGCRRGTPVRTIEEALFQALERQDCTQEAVAAMASIDLKKDEPGLLGLAEKIQAPFRTYQARELLELEGEFTESAFVARTTGVGNVCERAALKSVSETAAGGRIICGKQVVSGVTVALAEETWKGIL